MICMPRCSRRTVFGAGLALLLVVAVGCGSGGEAKKEPTPEELAEYQEAVKKIADWEDEIRWLRGKHHTAVKVHVDALKNTLAQAAKDTADDDATTRAVKEELFAFAKDQTDVPTNPITLEAAKSYVDERLALERAFMETLKEVKSRRPQPHASRPISMHADRGLEEMNEETAVAIAAMVSAEQAVAAVDPSAPWPVVAATDPPPEIALNPDPMNEPRVVTLPPRETKPPVDTPMPKPPVEPKPPTISIAKPDPEKSKPKEFLGPAPANWAVVVDPGPKPEPVPAELAYQFPRVMKGGVIFTPGRSRVLAQGIGPSYIEGVRLHDLHTGQVLGEASGFSAKLDEIKTTGPAISPDGTYLALHNSTAGGIAIGNILTKKPVALLPYPDDSVVIQFPTKDRVLAMSEDSPARLWSLPDGGLVREFPVVEEIADEAGTIVCSPGGRFVAVSTEGSPPELLVFYDLETGREAGRIKPPGHQRVDATIRGLAFSPDGTELAMYVFGLPVGLSIGHGLLVYDVETGRLLEARPVSGGSGIGSGAMVEPLQWFPDGKGWLLEHRYVIDRRTLKITDTVKPGGELFNYQYTKVLDDTRVLYAGVGGSMLLPKTVNRDPK